METLTLTKREQARFQVLNSLLAEHMNTDQAATLMGLSVRHTRRLLAAYRESGAAALAHGNRGRRPSNTTSDTLIARVVHLARTRYQGANHTHLSELLREREGMDVGRTTLRRILVGAGVDSPRRRRPPQHRVRRQRMPREGMLIQIDGSHHRWLGDDGQQSTLLLAVDDATGMVVNALFCEYENTHDYFMLMRGLIERSGIPIALYTDRHSVFKHMPGSGLSGAPTQFSRAMDRLGVQMIFALSPQAKGRVERTAGTFQDRLVTELRLAGATDIKEANFVLDDFLDRFNERFGVPAQEPESAYRPTDPQMCMDTVLCFKHTRKVARDNTVKYRWRTLQLLRGIERPSYAGSNLEVIEMLDGQLVVEHHGHIVSSQEAPSVRSSCAASTNDLHTSSFHRSIATVSVGDGLKYWRHSTRSERPVRLMTPLLPTAPQVFGVDQSAREGSPRHFRQQDGKLYRRRSAGGCRFEGLLGSWVSIGARPGSTWKLRVRPWHALEYQRDPLSLITFRTEQMTFSLNS